MKIQISLEGAEELRNLSNVLQIEQAKIEDETTKLQTMIMGLSSDLGIYEEPIGDNIARMQAVLGQVSEQIEGLIPLIEVWADSIIEMVHKK